MTKVNTPLCLLHVPKSAGSSVRDALVRALPPEGMSPKRWDSTHLNASLDVDLLEPAARAEGVVERDEIERLSAHQVVCGHFSLSTLLQITDARSVSIVLREPRSRLLSLYAFLRLWDDPGWRADPRLEHARRPLDEFLAEPAVGESTDNVLCRMLTHGDARIPKPGFIGRADVDALASRAIDALQTLGFVGIVELGESMWEGLSAFFGMSLTPARVNVTASLGPTAEMPPATFEISPRTLDLLEARTAVDSIVYRHALGAAGLSTRDAESLAMAAFADGLVGFGNAIGSSGNEWRRAARMVNNLIDERGYKDRELEHRADELRQARELQLQTESQLHRTEEDLRAHRVWLKGIRTSASWRLTAPARAAKRAVLQRRDHSGRRRA